MLTILTTNGLFIIAGAKPIRLKIIGDSPRQRQPQKNTVRGITESPDSLVSAQKKPRWVRRPIEANFFPLTH